MYSYFILAGINNVHISATIVSCVCTFLWISFQGIVLRANVCLNVAHLHSTTVDKKSTNGKKATGKKAAGDSQQLLNV